MSHRVLKYWLLCSKVISNVTSQDNSRATAHTTSLFHSATNTWTYQAASLLSAVHLKLCLILYCPKSVKFPIHCNTNSEAAPHAALPCLLLHPSILLRPKFSSAVISYCNTENSVVRNINWSRRFCWTQLLIPLLQIHSCTTCFGLFLCYYLHLWSAMLLLHIVCVKCYLKVAKCEQAETCLYLYICDVGIEIHVKLKYSAVTCRSPLDRLQQPVLSH